MVPTILWKPVWAVLPTSGAEMTAAVMAAHVQSPLNVRPTKLFGPTSRDREMNRSTEIPSRIPSASGIGSCTPKSGSIAQNDLFDEDLIDANMPVSARTTHRPHMYRATDKKCGEIYSGLLLDDFGLMVRKTTPFVP